ncbi:P-loop containing nucleoside triphosphate hydrolase protein, partial [Lentithecium fluviatile CBS 122367]
GTQCALLEKRFNCADLSVGDLLRAEADKPESTWAKILQENLRTGRVGTKEMTGGIMKGAVDELVVKGVQTIILDGFPQKLETTEYFEEFVKPFACVLVLECPVEVLQKRLLERRRADDDAETIVKRVDVYNQTTAVVLDKYKAAGKLVRVDADAEVVKVAAEIKRVLEASGVRLEARQ